MSKLRDLERFSLFPIIKRFVQLRKRQDEKPWSTISRLFYHLLPVTIGALILCLFDSSANNISVFTPVMSFAGILTAGFLSGTVLLFNLRIKLAESTNLHQPRSLGQHVTTATVQCFYLILPSAAILCVALAGAVFWSQFQHGPEAIILDIAMAICGYLMMHVLINSAMLLRGIFGLFHNLFRSESNRNMPRTNMMLPR